MEIKYKDCTISHDGRQYVLTTKAKSKKEGKETDRILGYHVSAMSLLDGVIKHKLGNDAVSDIRSVMSAIKDAKDDVINFIGEMK